ncbi:MAG: hypothetical protein HRU07_07460 [Nitrosopumilus sp.]|nr:hypothetical protein [Nitrosopumilus sp.]NRA05976.1 hypothetical protein [Nitrosopumilus sp.]
MEKSDYLDHIILETLNLLNKSKNGLRYGDLKLKLNVSDTSLVNRLNKLKTSNYVTSKAQITDIGKNYFAYTLTDFGIQLVKELDVEKLLNNVEKLLNNVENHLTR